ncbi:MAG: amidohydrolase family protein [Planctomycetaceae bacterium]|nr:amidohydrolase family protein [Planctomycetaceae bacterium]
MTSSSLNLPGLPAASQLRSYRIWDAYFTPAHGHPGRDGSSQLLRDMELSEPAIQKGQFEKLCYFPHVGLGTTTDADLEQRLRAHPQLVMVPFERWPDRLLGMIQVNAYDVPRSREAIRRWIQDGPMIGAYFPGGGPAAMTCTHRNVALLVEAVVSAGGVIMQHTWYKTGGKQGPGESTPAELAELARHYPEHSFICAHAGGEWEQGIRAIRGEKNVLIETSGFDATAGFLERAVRELGANRILFGSHLPSRSLGTELGKVLGAELTEADKQRILGTNFRQLLQRDET